MSHPPRLTEPELVDPGEDWWAMGELFSLAVDRMVAPVEGMHRAIANRWLGFAGAPAQTLRTGYDAATRTVYGSVRLAASALAIILPIGAELARTGNAPSQPSPVRGRLQAAANALWGDRLDREGSRLAIAMGFRDRTGRPLPATTSSCAAAFPAATGKLAVVLHGLGETDQSWHIGKEADGLAEVLDDAGWSSVFVRYNTGRHISANGTDLSALLEELVRAWPVPVETIALVGQSMGGLVARSALATGFAAGDTWASATRSLVALGAPHLGSPLEKGANILAWGLSHTPESQPLGDFLRERSVGIKDLRFGRVREADWTDKDPDALLDDALEDVTPPEGVNQHFVAGVITAQASHPVGVVVGDLVVRVGSATGSGRRRRVAASDVLVLGKRRHFDLATEPAVHEQIRSWLTADHDRPGLG